MFPPKHNNIVLMFPFFGNDALSLCPFSTNNASSLPSIAPHHLFAMFLMHIVNMHAEVGRLFG